MPLFHRCLWVLLLAPLALASSRPLSARQQVPSAPAYTAPIAEQLQQAERLLAEGKGNLAFPLFERALAEAAGRSLELEEAAARFGLGEILRYRTQYAAARDHAAKALEIYERRAHARGIGRASHLLSVVEDYSGNTAAARVHAERAVASFDSEQDLHGRGIATLQLLRVSRFDEAEARRLFDRTIRDAQAAGDAILEGRIWHSLGDHAFSAGLHEDALEALTRAEAIFQTSAQAAALGTVYNSIGRVYRAHGRLDEALKSQHKALALHEKVNSPFELMQSLNAVATVYHRLGDLRNARRYYERALSMAEKSSSVRVQDLVRASLGSLLVEQGQFAQGARALERVIANGVDAYPNRRQASLSIAYRGLARPQDALAAATRSVDGCAGDEDSCINALAQRAAAHTMLGNSQAALTDVNAALDTIEAVRARLVPTDFFKQEFHRAQEYIYSLAISLQLREKDNRAALETAELARSRAFLDLLASRDIRVRGPDGSLVESMRGVQTPSRIELQASAARPSGLVLRGGDPGATGSSPREATANPGLQSFATATPSRAADLAATASRLGSTLVVYWLGQDELVIWVVTSDGSVHARRVAVLPATLRELVRQTSPITDAPAAPMRNVVTRGASTIALRADRGTAWRGLYDLLIQPIRALLPKAAGSLLTIVPQGPLLNVSFAALRSPEGRYLLEDYALHYAPAGAMLQFTAPRKRPDARTGEMLLVADPALPRLTALDRPLPRLPGARGEATAIARLQAAERLTILQDTAATESRAREAMAGKAVLHFATHAVVSDDDPFGSYLALGSSTGDMPADGLLTSQEVYGLELNADLVVLSACRSAGGRMTGDGISAFARAFIYAGTASLVASLWDVADEPTNRLLPDFYKAWLAGESKSRALRAAQLRLLRDLRAGRVQITTPVGTVAVPEHPVFWAGFVLFGEPD